MEIAYQDIEQQPIQNWTRATFNGASSVEQDEKEQQLVREVNLEQQATLPMVIEQSE